MVKIEILWGEVKFLTGSTVCEESGATLSRIGEIPIPTVKSGRKKKKTAELRRLQFHAQNAPIFLSGRSIFTKNKKAGVYYG